MILNRDFPFALCAQTAGNVHGDYSFAFEFLPDIIFLFIFYQGDEESPAGANILMDKTLNATLMQKI